MKNFVFWTGIISVLSGAGLQFPALSQAAIPAEPPGMLVHLFGLMAMFLGVMLLVSSRDLSRRGPLVAWEGVLRLGGFCLMLGYGIWGGGGATMVAGGTFDLIVGTVYLVWLPRFLNATTLDLLLDRRSNQHTPVIQR